ncbi:MAG: enoyl-CoA hydratase-related protein [Terricaulis sp.]
MADMAEPILLDVTAEGVAFVTLNRPAKHNAFDEEVIAKLADTFETLKGADNVRIVFVRGNGPSFCAGADIEWMKRSAQLTDVDNETDALALARMLKHLHDLPQLTVAVVHGAAMGGGAGLVAACDVAIALGDTKFRFSEVRLGLTPATISPYVIEAVGPRWAKALFATAESFDVIFAEKIGLVQYAVEDMAAAQRLMEHLTDLTKAAAPGAVADAKALVRFVAGHKIDDGLAKETAKRIAQRRASKEGREGLAAFLEKRKPEWNS